MKRKARQGGDFFKNVKRRAVEIGHTDLRDLISGKAEIRALKAGTDTVADIVEIIAGQVKIEKRPHGKAPPGPLAMEVELPQKHKASNLEAIVQGKMPHRARKRKRRKSRFRRRNASAKRRRKSVRRGRKRRRSIRRPLRLYPGGMPLTHKLKMRSTRQCLIKSSAGKWGTLTLHPGSMQQPFASMQTAEDTYMVASGNQTRLPFTDKAGVANVNAGQPQGYDYWLGITASGKYRKYKVLGCQIIVAFIADTASTGGAQHYAGFTGLMGQSDDYGDTFSTKYRFVNDVEVSDMLNNAIIKGPKIITSGGTDFGGVHKAFVFNYSQKRYERYLKKVGARQGATGAMDAWYGTHTTGPTITPKARFVICDIGVDTAPVTYNVIINHTWTVQLSDVIIPDASVDS